MKYLILSFVLCFSSIYLLSQCTQNENAIIKSSEKFLKQNNYVGLDSLIKSLDSINSTCIKIAEMRVGLRTQLKQFDAAELALKKLMQINTNLKSPNKFSIYILNKKKLFDKALEEIHLCLKRDTDIIEQQALLKIRVEIRTQRKEYKAAYEDNVTLFSIDTNNMHSLLMMIQHEFYTDQKKKFIDHVALYRSMKRNTEAYHIDLASIYMLLKDYKSAFGIYRKLVKLYPKNSIYNMDLGMCFAYLKHYDSAIYFTTKSIELKPENSLAWNNRGFSKIVLEDYKTAISDLQKSIELNSKDPQPYNNLGYVYSQLGGKENKELAKKYYQQSLDLGGSEYRPYWKY